jgi:hypothetical protein
VGHSIDDIFFFFFRGSFVSFYCGFVGWLIGWSFAANPRLMKLWAKSPPSVEANSKQQRQEKEVRRVLFQLSGNSHEMAALI